MKELVWFLIVFICTEITFSKPQSLQDQLRIHLDPLNQPEPEFLHKNQGKRTIFPAKQYLFGKHVAIDSHGHKFLLGYSPLNVKYPPFLRPVGVFKPAFHHNNIAPWRPLNQYLPSAAQVPNPVQFADNGWKPILPPSTLSRPALDHLKLWDGGLNHAVSQLPSVQHINPAQPVHPIQSINFPSINQIQSVHPVQSINFPSINQIQSVHPAHSVHSGLPGYHIHSEHSEHPVRQTHPIHLGHHVHPVQPAVPVIPAAVKPLLHNYYYFQTPVSKPVILPQQPLFEVTRPQLPVLPLGAAFPVPVAHPQNVHPPEPIFFQPQQEIPIVHDHHHHQHHHHPHLFTPSHHHLQPQPTVPIHSHVPEQPLHMPPSLSIPVSFPPLTVEFHGNHHVNPFNLHTPSINSTPLFTNFNSPPILYGRQPHELEFSTNNNEYLPPINHFQPINDHPQHNTHEQPQVLFNPAIRPGHKDLHIPDHLPSHPQFTTITDHNLLPPYPNNFVKPSNSLEPPFTPLHT